MTWSTTTITSHPLSRAAAAAATAAATPRSHAPPAYAECRSLLFFLLPVLLVMRLPSALLRPEHARLLRVWPGPGHGGRSRPLPPPHACLQVVVGDGQRVVAMRKGAHKSTTARMDHQPEGLAPQEQGSRHTRAGAGGGGYACRPPSPSPLRAGPGRAGVGRRAARRALYRTLSSRPTTSPRQYFACASAILEATWRYTGVCVCVWQWWWVGRAGWRDVERCNMQPAGSAGLTGGLG